MIQTEALLTNNSPYFLKGLAYAKNILLQLKKQKKEQLELSPITRKHTKVSTEPIVQEKSKNLNSILENQCVEEGTLTVENRLTIKEEIQNYENEINKIGGQLQKVNKDIETYEVVFENLCDYYSANQEIPFRHNKAKRENIRLREERQKIRQKIQQCEQKLNEVSQNEKKAREYIKNSVQKYVTSVYEYNHQQFSLQHLPTLNKPFPAQWVEKLQEEEEDEVYEKELSFRYKKLAVEKEENKKKTIIEPKKLSKGISFEEEIDVVSRYYESELAGL